MRQDPTATMPAIMMGKNVATLANARSAASTQLSGGRTTTTLELKQLLRALGYFCTQEMASFFLDALFDEGFVRRVNTGPFLMYWNATDTQIPDAAQEFVDLYGEDLKDTDDDDDDDVDPSHAMGVKQLLTNTGVTTQAATSASTKPLLTGTMGVTNIDALPDDAWVTYEGGITLFAAYDGGITRSKARWQFATDHGRNYDEVGAMRVSTLRKRGN